jgi:hypothetical protein
MAVIMYKSITHSLPISKNVKNKMHESTVLSFALYDCGT